MEQSLVIPSLAATPNLVRMLTDDASPAEHLGQIAEARKALSA